MDELLAMLAGEAHWWQVAPRLAELSVEECEEIAPRLAKWPDEVREAPQAWLTGEPPAALSLCRTLSLVETRVESEALARLFGRAELAGITRLELGMIARGFNKEWLRGLGELRELRIVTYDPYTTAVTDDEVAELAGCSLPRLERLSLDMVRLRGPGVAALAKSDNFPMLRELELYTPATAQVCKALAWPGPLRGLKRLALCADGFTTGAAAALCGAEFVCKLEALELRVSESDGFDWTRRFSGSDGGRNARELARALTWLLPGMLNCEYVSVEYCPDGQVVKIGREEFAALADPKKLRARFPAAMRGA